MRIFGIFAAVALLFVTPVAAEEELREWLFTFQVVKNRVELHQEAFGRALKEHENGKISQEVRENLTHSNTRLASALVESADSIKFYRNKYQKDAADCLSQKKDSCQKEIGDEILFQDWSAKASTILEKNALALLMSQDLMSNQ